MERKVGSIVKGEYYESIQDSDKLSLATMAGKGYVKDRGRRHIYKENGKLKIPVNQTFPMQGKDYDTPDYVKCREYHIGKRKARHDCYGVIYMIMHDKSGRAYIGQTTQLIPDRVRYSIRCAFDKHNGLFNTRLSCAFREYGIEEFTVWELSRHYSREELDRAEIETIKKYSTNHFAGFNSESGGKKNFTYNKETLERMRNSRVGERNGRYGKPVSEETRRKIGQANRGYRSAWKGKKHTEDELKRIGESNREYYRLHPERAEAISARMKKKVICCNTGVIFNSLKDAAKSIGTSNGAISRVCRGKRKAIKGFHFEYYTENQK